MNSKYFLFSHNILATLINCIVRSFTKLKSLLSLTVFVDLEDPIPNTPLFVVTTVFSLTNILSNFNARVPNPKRFLDRFFTKFWSNLTLKNFWLVQRILATSAIAWTPNFNIIEFIANEVVVYPLSSIVSKRFINPSTVLPTPFAQSTVG